LIASFDILKGRCGYPLFALENTDDYLNLFLVSGSKPVNTHQSLATSI